MNSFQKKNQVVVNEYSKATFEYEREVKELYKMDPEIERLEAEYLMINDRMTEAMKEFTGFSEDKLVDLTVNFEGASDEDNLIMENAYHDENVLNILYPFAETGRDLAHLRGIRYKAYIKVVTKMLRACNAALDNAGEYTDQVLDIIREDRVKYTDALVNARLKVEEADTDYQNALQTLEVRFHAGGEVTIN